MGYAAFLVGVGGIMLGPPVASLFVDITVAAIALVVLSGIPLIIAALSVRCPCCLQRVLVSSGAQPHPHARRLWVFPGYKILVIDIVRRGRFSCYHCGKECSVS
jgi:hypothetical protein